MVFYNGVLRVLVEGRTYYACGICGLVYRRREHAEACLEYCRCYRACSLVLERLAIGRIEPGAMKSMRLK